MGDIDRIHQLAQSAKLINAYQRVNPNGQRNSSKKDTKHREDQKDKIELSEGDQEMPIALEIVSSEEDDGGLDIAV